METGGGDRAKCFGRASHSGSSLIVAVSSWCSSSSDMSAKASVNARSMVGDSGGKAVSSSTSIDASIARKRVGGAQRDSAKWNGNARENECKDQDGNGFGQ